MNVALVVANVLELLALLLQILCVGLPYWYGKSPLYYGLFETCASVNGDNYVCRSYAAGGSAQPEWLGATAGLEVIVLALVFFALVAGSCAMCCMVYDAVLYVIAAILALFAALTGTVALIVFGAKFGDDNAWDGSHLHASFYIAIFATLFTLIAGIVYIVAKPKSAVKSFEQFDD
ncbi:uncharacterized protein LOC132715465 [Ruditapes philippinarum]|uniref:uncharacterized protein LOC132715465 n=1 Tax=Ruditapes philippinarum TaxID=129788 RepID=UPI00295BC455|nr:uncharacterized protein LOC132715465 [Ruditapes philippinarum]